MRGDEPQLIDAGIDQEDVFPTCVGMNRLLKRPIVSPRSFPHMRGDEPMSEAEKESLREFPPHAWG